MKTKSFVILATLGALLATGCHSSRKIAVPPTVATDTTIVTPEPTVAKREYAVVSFNGDVEGVTVNGQLRVARDSVIWLSVYKIIEVGRAMATPDSLWLKAPMLGRDDAIDYKTLSRKLKHTITFDDLQTLALGDNAEAEINAIAQQMGINAHIRITRREQVEHLNFPFKR
ncbi:MAG: DUF4292 domain-containing protein [Bacteroidales bacterium]|nr:DUF4292 domain-containing protein [Bacteroidales bacterium]